MVANEEIVREVVREIIQQFDCYLVDLKINTHGKRIFIRVIAESLDGITLDELTCITRAINADPYIDEAFPENYQLEVTSPGVNHPLREYRDFPRNIDRKLRVRHRVAEQKNPLLGKLVNVDDEQITLQTEQGAIKVAFRDLDFAKVILKW